MLRHGGRVDLEIWTLGPDYLLSTPGSVARLSVVSWKK